MTYPLHLIPTLDYYTDPICKTWGPLGEYWREYWYVDACKDCVNKYDLRDHFKVIALNVNKYKYIELSRECDICEKIVTEYYHVVCKYRQYDV